MPSRDSYGPTEPAPRCRAHGGEHAVLEGHCVAMGAQVPRPILFSRRSWTCDCGRRVYSGIERKTMQHWLIDEASGERHDCPPPVRVEIDQEALTLGISGALASLMRRRDEQRATQPRSAPPEPRRREEQPVSGTGVPDSPHRVKLD
jgi:hypothetical protein